MGSLDSGRGVPGCGEKEPACSSPPPWEAERQGWYMDEPPGMAGALLERGIHGTLGCANGKANLQAWPDFPRFLPVDSGHFKA